MRHNDWRAYRVGSNFFWGGWTKADRAGTYNPQCVQKIGAEYLACAIDLAKKAASQMGWDGCCEQIYVSGLPAGAGDCECFVVAIQQGEGDALFIWSPFPLDHLMDDADMYCSPDGVHPARATA